jgi:hypothetical protein
MFVPTIPTGVEESRQLPRDWVEAGNVWALVKIAMDTGKREVRKIITPFMLAGDDMLNLMAGP